MNRSGLVLVGMAVVIIGYAVTYAGMTKLNPALSPTHKPVGIMDSLVPGKVKGRC